LWVDGDLKSAAVSLKPEDYVWKNYMVCIRQDFFLKKPIKTGFTLFSFLQKSAFFGLGPVLFIESPGQSLTFKSPDVPTFFLKLSPLVICK
jgi:hypothetical protein